MTEEQLIARYIEPNPHKGGLAEARLVDYGIAVWALIAYWQGVQGDAAQVANDYDIPREAVEAALAYYRRHQNVIEARLAANAA